MCFNSSLEHVWSFGMWMCAGRAPKELRWQSASGEVRGQSSKGGALAELKAARRPQRKKADIQVSTFRACVFLHMGLSCELKVSGGGAPPGLGRTRTVRATRRAVGAAREATARAVRRNLEPSRSNDVQVHPPWTPWPPLAALVALPALPALLALAALTALTWTCVGL